MCCLCPTRPEKKIGADGCYFSEVPSLRKEISTSGLHILLLGNYMSLHSKMEPAAIKIYRDITKRLTCYGFFLFIRLCFRNNRKSELTLLKLENQRYLVIYHIIVQKKVSRIPLITGLAISHFKTKGLLKLQ